MPASYRDLRSVAVNHFSVHWIGRLLESGVYESDNLTTELRDKSDRLLTGVPQVE
jgi:hypothetical protein